MLLTIHPLNRYNTLEIKLEREVTSMNYPFSKKSFISRLVSLTLVMLLMLTMLGGCSLLPSKTTNEPSTEPSEDVSANQPNIVDEPETTEAPTTEATVPPTTEAKKENVAVVREQTSIRSSPSSGSRVNAQVDAGEELEVLRIESIGEVKWAWVSSDTLNIMGWVVVDMLDMSNVTLDYNDNSTPANSDSNESTTGTTQPAGNDSINSITGTGTGTTPANSQVGTVNTNTLNIRASASINGDKVGTYTFGDRITILETSNGWGRTDKGWVSMKYVTLGTTTGGTTNSGGTGNATITGSGVNVRSGAGTDYPVVATAQKGESVTIHETTTVGTTQWGRTDKGWICMDYVSVTGSIGTTGGTGTGASGTATVTGNGLNIRSGAGTDYNIVGSLSKGDNVTILETVTIGTSKWGRIRQGWICLDYVRMN